MNERSGDGIRDSHEHDLVMPGFRFHPTEEELIEFYLRRKVEGKKFNVEIITFLDLYRYDPWELPAMAAIGEKEWFFYVPRDRKYRNGDRPNRVTSSGYWKATGADRMIRSENNRPIGLKKTLVFYSGKAPKGIRTSWIMNEYRLPPSDIERYQKAEISLCRVYKRTGVEDNSSHSPTKASSSRNRSGSVPEKKHASANSPPEPTLLQGDNCLTPMTIDKAHDSLPIRSNMTSLNTATTLIVPKPLMYGSTASVASLNSTTTSALEDGPSLLYHSKNSISLGSTYSLINVSSSPAMVSNPNIHDDLSTLIGHHHGYTDVNHIFPLQSQTSLVPVNTVPMPLATVVSDKLWDWTPIPDAARDHTGFK